MNAEEFESLVEGLIPEIAYSGEKGVSVSSLLKIVKDYYHGLDVEAGGAFRNDVVDPALMGSSSDVESSLSEAELASARWAWNWLKSRPQILIGGDKRWNRLSLEEVLALPEAPEPVVDIETADSTAKPAKKTTDTKKTKSKKLTERPRIYPSEDLVWQTLTRHGVDYKKVPPLEWKCLLGIASARGEGILQSHLRQLTGQDKRSLPKRTDALARKGYVAKRTVVVQKMKTSKLWLIDFAPPVLDQRESGGKLDFSQETLRKDLEPVAWRERWTGNNIDMDAFARTFVAIIKAWQIIRYSDLRSKMGINGQRWQMKTLAKNTQRLVDMGVLRYTAASFPGSRKVFKDCLKFVREPRGDEWEKFLATGKKTSQYSEPGRLQEPKPNALVIHQKSDPSQRDKRKRISPGWIPDKPLAQTTFEVIQSAGPEGASTPQISAATVGYSFRRYMASLLTKLADAKQPPHLKKFQVVSDLVRTGKTSAYMFSVARPEDGAAAQAAIDPQLEGTDADPYGFGKVSRKAFPKGEKELSLSELSRMAGKPRSRTQRKHLVLVREIVLEPATEPATEEPAAEAMHVDVQEEAPQTLEKLRGKKRPREDDEAEEHHDEAAVAEGGDALKTSNVDSVPTTTFTAVNTQAAADKPPNPSVDAIAGESQTEELQEIVFVVRYNGMAGKLQLSRPNRALTFVRSGRGAKKPLTVNIDEIDGEPSIRDVPGSDDMSLVFITRGAGDDKPTFQYVFIFDDDVENRSKADSVLREMIKMKASPTSDEPTVQEPGPSSLQDAPEDAPQEEGQATPPKSPAGRGRGRGRGGARGRGRGRGGAAASTAAKPFTCATCGNSWKNLLGLQYHQTKAQVACNPSYVPGPPVERPRKRRKLTPPPEETPVASIASPAAEVTEPMTNYDRFASEAKKKTAQAYDIVNYLLDNNCGVFPGDKSLFYALLKIFLKEFRNQVPPTFKNCNAAVKALEARKLATLHTHMLKTERGKLITCTLLLRTGIDPGSLVPGVMKQKMRESYPSIFIPAAFSPTEEELVLLESLDKKPGSGLQDDRPNRNGPKFRNRRRIEEVEVFNAPYYAQTGHDSIRDNNDPLWDTGYRSRKRRALDESATDNIAAKRQRMDSQEPTTALDDMPLDPQLLALSQGHASQKETPSVFEAVKNFGLLPPKRGPRKTYNTPPTPKKLPRKLGRSRNPGLRSLPAWFFDNKVGGPPQPASINIRFLKPNTHLEDVVEDAGGSVITRRGPPITGPAATAEMDNIDPRLLPGYEASQGSTNPVKEHVLVAPEALKDSPLSGQGSWPLLNLNHFEVEHSLTMEGWWPTNKVLLAHLMPSTAEDMANRNKGTSWRTDNWTDQDWAKFWTTVQGCQTWELSDLGKAAMLSGSIAPDHKFINFSAPESKSGMKPVTLEWSDENQFAVDTLPYAELEDESDDDEDYVLPKKRRASGAAAGQRTPSKKRRTTEGQQNAGGRPGVGGRPPKFKLPAIKTSREMTPYPKTPEEFFRAPGGGDKDDDGFDWSSENTQLTAFVVFTTLLGGVDKVVDWGLMLRLYPDMSITQLRHKWTALRKDRQSTIVNLSHWFRKVFLKAYTENELPPLDFDNVLAYDWRYLVKWTVNLQSHERGVVLPKTRKLLEKEFRLSGQKYENREWREAYYHVQRSVFNRFQDATLEALAYPIDPDLPTHDSNSPIPEYDNVLAASMAWTRSLCVTPIDAYSAEDVLRRRSSLFPGLLRSELVDVIVKGVDQLQREGIISKSTAMSTNGRHWRFNHRVMETLEKVCNQSKLAQAVAFKRDLDAAFKVDPDKKKRVTYITNDGMIMALLNMQAHGRIRVETTGQPNVPMGFEPGNYETRKYTKKYLHFRLDIVRTDRYIFDEDQEMVDMRDRIRGAEPPTTPKVEEEMPEEEEQGVTPVPVPVWCDVFGRVDMERWMKYLSAVLFSIASRGAMRPEELVKKLRPTIMKFEVELILEWCKHQGLLQEQLEGVALNCSEWWWIAVDAQKERQRQMQQGQGNKGKGVERLGWVGGGGGAGAGDGGGQEEPAVHLREQTGAYPSVPVAAM
ncbi:hypothetical protein QBC46DRAFT_312979 [Diplogelasinospora grovesii]|uniref:Uncharacterized protein n=1 Tax=Diplogelasinospora grovesii TaxID=303347 RepID=A0AAN6NAH4_9PEZI|nr:hypothetical protein QBC46DRAFT_312979 [Diplogelasinospora grovesii]